MGCLLICECPQCEADMKVFKIIKGTLIYKGFHKNGTYSFEWCPECGQKAMVNFNDDISFKGWHKIREVRL